MDTGVTRTQIDEVRSFNRFFTNRLGILRAGLLDSPWSLTEVRVLYELAHSERTEAPQLRRALDIDAGQLSRVLGRLDNSGLLTRAPSPDDARRQTVQLTEAGERAAAVMSARSDAQVREQLERLGPGDRERLVTAVRTVRRLFADPPETSPAAGAVVLRPLRPGDLGWVVQRHGAVYGAEQGWDQTFEALAARLVADYGRAHDPRRESAWIAEVGGERAGSVFCVRSEDEETAKLRLLLVEPDFRGLGLGSRLVEECVAFARAAGYRRMTLWTNDVLTSARRVYQRAGFLLVSSEPHHSYGADLVGQTWEREL